MNQLNINLVSDLHLEFGTGTLVPCRASNVDVYILAGDIFNSTFNTEQTDKTPAQQQALNYMRSLCQIGKPVLMVQGNHEAYASSSHKPAPETATYDHSLKRWQAFAKDHPNFHILDTGDCDAPAGYIDIDGVRFIGTRLCSEIDDPTATTNMSDFNENKVRHWTTHDHLNFFYRACTHLSHLLTEAKTSNIPVVVITHHAPSFQDVELWNKNPSNNNTPSISDDLTVKKNSHYASNLQTLIIKHQPIAWLHGHIHTSLDYVIDKTRVVCNPRGYLYGEDSISHKEQYWKSCNQCQTRNRENVTRCKGCGASIKAIDYDNWKALDGHQNHQFDANLIICIAIPSEKVLNKLKHKIDNFVDWLGR